MCRPVRLAHPHVIAGLKRLLSDKVITRQHRHVVHAFAERLSSRAVRTHEATRTTVLKLPVPDHTASSFDQIMEATGDEIKQLHKDLEVLARPANRVRQYERRRRRARENGVMSADQKLVLRNRRWVPLPPLH